MNYAVESEGKSRRTSLWNFCKRSARTGGMINKTMIEFQHIRKSYGAGRERLPAFHRKERLSMIGSSGCGKTTALKLINGLLIPDEGTIRIEGTDIQTMDQNVLRRNIG
ncbi:MAG: ATP-binding cassette domain-containing protein [Merdibacter sp.]